jgi:signal transduction histidine kinase
VLGLLVLLVLNGQLLGKGELNAVAIPALALVTLPLLWRSSAPQVTLALTVAGVFACLATLKPLDVVVLPAMVAAYSATLVADRRRSVLLAAILVPIAIVGVLLSADDGAFREIVLNGTLILLAVATGDAARARRAYRQSVREREAEREREQRAEAMKLVAEERLRISREVHDVVAHAMVGINVQAGVAAHMIHRNPDAAQRALEMIKATSGAALTDLRSTLGVLRDDGDAAQLAPTERLSGIPDLAGPLRAAGVEVEIILGGPHERVPWSVGAAAYRIAQEASTNILRHAGARRATIAVLVGRDALDVRVEDDGATLAPVGGPVDAGSGSGLRGMAERAKSFGGHVEAGRQPDGHWRVHAVLPLA